MSRTSFMRRNNFIKQVWDRIFSWCPAFFRIQTLPIILFLNFSLLAILSEIYMLFPFSPNFIFHLPFPFFHLLYIFQKAIFSLDINISFLLLIRVLNKIFLLHLFFFRKYATCTDSVLLDVLIHIATFFFFDRLP